MRVPVARDAPVEQHEQTTAQPVARPIPRDVAASVARAVAQHEQNTEQLPAPGVSLMPRKGLKEPDAPFLRDIATCIRAGVRPLLAAQWLGVSRKTFKAWRSRQGPLYDDLRSTIARARAHLEVKLMSELAKRSPGAALKGLRRVRDDDPDEPSRRYDKAGLYSLKKALPALLDRVNDPAITDLSPVETAAREFREALLADLGGRERVSTAKLALLRTVTGSWLLLGTVDAYLAELANATGVVNRRTRSVFAVVEQRARLADSPTRQLQTLGLDRVSAPPQNLDQYLAQKYGQNGDTPDPSKEPAP